MSEWPDDWFRGGRSAGSEPGPTDPTVGIPVGQGSAGQAGQYRAGQYGTSGVGQAQAAPPGAWPAQPPATSRPGGPGHVGGDPGSGGGRRRSRPRLILAIVAALVALVVIGTAATYLYLNSQLTRQDILVNYAGRPAPGSGTNWLIAGSDGRQGLTVQQEREYATGFSSEISGARSDTIMILHIPSGGGRPLLISIPRDSYVDIPGYGMDKINAAFDLGGPKLLAETVQNATGLYINHFMDIGFGGFVSVVNDVGGVRMCLVAPLHDVASGVDLKAGCQTLSGGEALAYVRDRHNFATQDLQREQDERIFLKALLDKMTSPSVALNPFKAFPAANGAVHTLTVDNGTSLYQLISVARALRDPLTTTVPIATATYWTPNNVGEAVLWNSQQAKELFTDLQTGQPVPSSLITGSSQAAPSS
ncbi:MAG TPA: LCP family protein [Streptosporangiaceae bacterium]|nr:LCP family protein [Streptosporangiaceae bacterium]